MLVVVFPNNIKIADFGLSNVAHDGDFLRTSCGSPNYAAPEVISGNLYAGPEVDVWSCGVILYALLCGTLPFDDESIPNLFKKIKSGMYSLPSHLSQSARELILRMLVVDPIKRITIAEVRQHPWYQHKLPAYLTLPPAMMESQERYIDAEIVDKVCRLPIGGVTPALVTDAVENSHRQPDDINKHDLKVAYQLLLDEKRHKKRIEDVVMARKDTASTPPGQSPRLTGLGISPGSMSMRADSLMMSMMNSGSTPGKGQAVAAPVDTRDLSARRRRWYLGIQSKKDPAHVMNEVYKAMQALKCVWHQVNNYRVLCLWKYTSGAVPKTQSPTVNSSGTGLFGTGFGQSTAMNSMMVSGAGPFGNNLTMGSGTNALASAQQSLMGAYNPQMGLSGMTSSSASTLSQGHGQRGSGNNSGSVLGSRTSRDRDMSDHAVRLNHKHQQQQHVLPTPYADKNHMSTTMYMDDLDPESGDAMDAILSNAVGMLDHQGDPIVDDDEDLELGDQSNSDTEELTHEGSGNRARKRRRSKQAWSLMPAHTPDPNVKIALSLYKVQQNIYLLDFQRVEGDAFGFMKLCAFIITELKNLSAASRAAQPSSSAMAASASVPAAVPSTSLPPTGR